MVLFIVVHRLALGRTLLALGAAFTLAACAPVGSPRRASESPTVRCVDEPGRGQSLDPRRPLFFLFCTQSP